MKAIDLYNAGYTDLVSVIPPQAPLSSSTKILPKDRGKAPGVVFMSGLWGGYNWRQAPSLAEVRQMDATGANVGLMATRFPAIDIDVLDESLAEMVEGIVRSVVPALGPKRVGLPPKRLFPFRLEGDEFARLQLFILDGAARHLVEILASGQQYLVSGRHPKGHEYAWPEGDLCAVPAADLPPLSLDAARAVIAAIAEAMETLGYHVERSGSGDTRERIDVDQESLKANNLDVLELAVQATPNMSELFPAREDYIRLGYAIKGATQDDPARGLAMYTEWALRWEGGNTVEVITADWDRMRPPLALGADYVFDVAKKCGFNLAKYEFPDLPEEPPAARPPLDADARYSEVWMAREFVQEHHARLRYVPKAQRWAVWDGKFWRDDADGAIDHMVVEHCTYQANGVMREPANSDAKAAKTLAKSLCTAHMVSAVERLARSDRRIVSDIDAWNTHPDLLATPGGVIDLRSGAVNEPDPKLYISRGTSIVPAPDEATRWKRFLHDATGGDGDLEAYLQRLAGYCLTGHTKEEALFFCYGPGGRGKSTFIDTLSKAFGPLLAKRAAMQTFLASTYDRHPTDLAALAGSRMVVAEETQEGRSWDETKIKSLTGSEFVTARFMRQDEFTYIPTFKLVFTGNSRPHIENVGDADRRRINLIPFDHLPPVKDLNLKAYLAAHELPAILHWAIEGAREWYILGLNPPERVLLATKDYFEDEDPMGRWLEDACLLTPEAEADVADLFTNWVNWCDRNGESCGPKNRFSQRLLAGRGLRKVRTGVGRKVKGITLK